MSEGELLQKKLGPRSVTVAVIDGPYDKAGLAGILARPPISLGEESCGSIAGAACEHGTFVIGLLAARSDLDPPGLCPDCQLLHIPLFADGKPFGTDVCQLAAAIQTAVDAGANLINLSLAVIGDDREHHAGLGAALDRARAAGAVVVAAAGNQGRVARGQLLSHPATIPVVAVDRDGQPLQSSNLSAQIARHGVAALGSDVAGYGPGGVSTRMSGTSAATAVATGILAAVWASRLDVTGAAIRAAVTRLGGRGEFTPPTLDRMQLIAALDMVASAPSNTVHEPDRRQSRAYRGNIRGEAIMETNRGTDTFIPARQSVAPHGTPVALAGEGTCSCGAPGGQCTCEGTQADSGFVYAIGTVEAEYPNVAIEREMQALAHEMNIELEPDKDMPMRLTENRLWQYKVLSPNKPRTRYIARQLSWRLTVEDVPALVLTPRDPSDFDQLIDCLKRKKYPTPDNGRGRARGRARSDFRPGTSARPEDLDVVVGVRGPHTADGIEVTVDQIFQIEPEQYATTQGSGLFGYLAQLADNFGQTDRDRAYNYLIARYKFAEDKFENVGEDFELAAAPTIVSRLSRGGRIVDVILTFRSTTLMVEKKYFLRVDVTHEFPMILTGLNPYLDR
jgi:Subtilase family/PatG C-terminal/PatG Domain